MSEMSTQELMAASGITLSQVTHWADRNYLWPSNSAHPGSGYSHRWPASEAVVARCLRDYVYAGGPNAGAIHRLANAIRLGITEGDRWAVVTPDQALTTSSASKILALVAGGEVVTVACLSD